MHFRFAQRWLALLAASAMTLVAIGAHLSLPRAYVLMATTTSTRDTGLLPYLLPKFTEDRGIDVRYVAVGTGQALDLGRSGDVDVVMVHAPALEDAFMAAGDGLCRNPVMYNRFVIVGPTDDPADVRGAENATDAFRRIHGAAARFESRADNSGTHTKELEIWQRAGLDPSTFGAWYEKTNQGMGQTLTIANERDAYSLADEGTWFAREPTLPYLARLHAEDEPMLRNQYSVIPIDPSRHPGVRADLARELARWLVGEGQSWIAAFTVNGHAIFTPNGAGAC